MKYYISIIVLILLFSCQNKKNAISLSEEEEKAIFTMANSYFQPLPGIDWEGMDEKQKKQILLGKKLFYEKALSENQTQNCASCHKMDRFGQDNLPLSPGDLGQVGVRNVPSILNASLQFAQLWDASKPNVEEQATGPIFGHKEMGMKDTLELLRRIDSLPSYQKMFSDAFSPADSLISIENVKTALGAFVRTLLSPGRFDSYLKGDRKALTAPEKLGLKGFVDEGCIPCHSASLLGGQMAQKFAQFGYYWDYTGSTYLDKGKYQVSLEAADKFVFKVPQLRNVAETYPYFHDGSIPDLKQAIQIMGLSELNHLPEEGQLELIEIFLESLTGQVPDYAHEKGPFPFE